MFDKKRHYPLPETRWDRARAEQAIETIVREVIAQAESGEKWPVHPVDDWGVHSDFYLGRSGALWAVDYLQRVDAVATAFDVGPHLEDLLTENRNNYGEASHSENSSYLFGELPLLLMQHRMNPTENKAKDIAKSIRTNDDQPVRELMWGMAGSMLAARFMHRWTSDEVWADIYRYQAVRLLAEWQLVNEIGYLWNVEVYNTQKRFLGPVHGFAGNALALMAGFELLSNIQTKSIVTRLMESTVNTAVSDESFANWGAVFEEDDPGKAPEIVQYCHGAPGMIAALAALPVGENEEFDQILLKGGELVWHAGPLKKGANLCHGTGGNGYAFLKLFERTGDERWLERARRFAMHAIDQYKLAKELYRQPRYPLWTGDPGLAIYLWDCIGTQAKFPTIDVF